MNKVQMEDDRYATQRGRYLARTTELRLPEAQAIAYAERGYSSHGIAKNIDVSEATVKDYLQKAMALYGLEIAETVLPGEDESDYERVEPEYYTSLASEEERRTWIEYVDRHSDKLPQEWVNEIIDKAGDDNLMPEG